MESPVFAIESLSVFFEEHGETTPALQDVSLSFFAGKITAVIGASGSGKSVFAQAVMGLLPQTAHSTGRFYYDGEQLDEKQLAALRGREICLVPQSITSLDPLRKVHRQLRDGVLPAPSKEKAHQTLARYGLTDAEKKYPFQLSGGMARRVLISIAVMGNARLVIADEPTPGLDHKSARWVLRHFAEIAEAGAAVLLITHDLELAVEAADRVVVLYGGTLLEEGAAADFSARETLRHPYTKALWDAMPKNGFHPAPAFQQGGGSGGGRCVFADSCPLAHADCGQAVALRVLRGGMVRCARAL